MDYFAILELRKKGVFFLETVQFHVDLMLLMIVKKLLDLLKKH